MTAPNDKPAPWKNKIVGNALVPPSSLLPHDKNFREHPRMQVAALAGCIDEIGYIRSVTVSKRTGKILDGHARVRLAIDEGQEFIPVEYVDLTEEEEAIALATIDPIAAMALSNKEALENLLSQANARNEGLKNMLADLAQRNGLMLAGLNGGGLTDPDNIPDPPDAAITQPGDLWILGDHRLLCGDSSKPEDVDRLLDGEPIHLINSDPPYGVRVEPRSNNAIAAGLSSFQTTHHQKFDVERHPEKSQPTTRKLRAKDRPLANDFVTEEEFDRLLHAWFGNMARVLLPGHAFYIWGGYANCGNYPPLLKKVELYNSQAIIWDKQHPVLTRKDFMGAHEWCFYGWREGAAHRFFGPNNATDLWAVKKVNPQNMIHLTEKPVELAERAMQYSSRQGENVLDLFGGSGSTLIAAQRTERKAFLMELDQLYCDVIVRRWEEYTGRKAILQRETEPCQADDPQS